MGDSTKEKTRDRRKIEKHKYRVHKRLVGYCEVLELIFAIIVGMVLLYTTGKYLLAFLGFIDGPANTEIFHEFLTNVFNLVVGIEFIKMLLKPSADHVIEVLVFLVTRSIIIDHGSALSILLHVVSILLLYGFHFYLQYLRSRRDRLAKAIQNDTSELGGVEDSSLGTLN